MNENDLVFKQVSKSPVNPSMSADPFNIYSLLKKNKEEVVMENNMNNVTSDKSDPQFPHGFTPDVEKNNEKEVNSAKEVQPKDNGVASDVNESIGVSSIKSGGSLLDVMDELIKVGHAMGYNMEGCLGQKAKKGWIQELNSKHRVSFVTLQETKMESIDLFSIKALWGNFAFDYVLSPSVGFSGGILCAWDPNLFHKDNSTVSDSFVALRGTWIPSTTKILIITVYAPQDLNEKRMLWEFLGHLIDTWDGECVLLGDFNEVRSINERFGTLFNPHGAKSFNDFISLLAWLISPWKGLLTIFPSLSALCFDRHLSDHRPILMHKLNVDYDPIPFCLFHSWFNKNGFDKMVEDSWKSSALLEQNSIIKLKKKLQSLKTSIKQWFSEEKLRSNSTKMVIQNCLSDLDKIIDLGNGNEELVNERAKLLHELFDLNSKTSLDLLQKAKIRWAIEGDENSKYFHGIINKKRSQLAIRGVLAEGEWIMDPSNVKQELLNHFANRFATPNSPRVVLEYLFPNVLTSDQLDDLEKNISYEEIKKAV
ncbi:RNA-directed DNA polymerase, eukaryota [Tanacetum coccineum]